MVSLYDPGHLRRWFLEKQRPNHRDLINAAHQAVTVRETEKACQVQWLSDAGEILFESWVPKSAIELKRDSMTRVAGEDAAKTKLREWMWAHGLPSDGTETISELHNVVMMASMWVLLPDELKRADRQPYHPMGDYE